MPSRTSASLELFDRVVRVTYEYFGPAAERYVTRQIDCHLHKSPDQLRKKDLKELINWISVATSHLINDEAIVEEYTKKLHELRAPDRRKS
jgi:hypothetical protein